MYAFSFLIGELFIATALEITLSSRSTRRRPREPGHRGQGRSRRAAPVFPFGDQSQEVAAACSLVGLHNVPCREIAAADINHLPIIYQLLYRLPVLLPGCLTVDMVHLVEVSGQSAGGAGSLRRPDGYGVPTGATDSASHPLRCGPWLPGLSCRDVPHLVRASGQ